MFHESPVTFIFKCINVGIIIGLGIYIFKTYALPMIKEQMAKIKIHLKFLRDEDVRLDLEQQRVLYQGIEQHKLGEKLKKSLEVWRTHEYSRQIAVQREQEAIRQAMAQKVVQQGVFLKNKKIYDAVVPQVLHKAKQELEHKLAHTPQGQQYLHDLIKALE